MPALADRYDYSKNGEAGPGVLFGQVGPDGVELAGGAEQFVPAGNELRVLSYEELAGAS